MPTNTIGNVSTNVFLVSKLDTFGRPIYTTAIGGAGGQLALDAAGNLFVHGRANADSFGTTTGAYRTAGPSMYGNDFVCKLRATDGVVSFCALLLDDHQPQPDARAAKKLWLWQGVAALLALIALGLAGWILWPNLAAGPNHPFPGFPA